MERKAVESSNIKSVGHDQDTKILEVEFTNGSIYQYYPITKEGYLQLLAADSIGSYFYKHIRSSDRVTTKQIE